MYIFLIFLHIRVAGHQLQNFLGAHVHHGHELGDNANDVMEDLLFVEANVYQLLLNWGKHDLPTF